MKSKISNLQSLLEHFLFPWDVCCINCKNEHTVKYGLCESCLRDLSTLNEHRCEVCLDIIPSDGKCKECFALPPDYERLFSAFSFGGILRELMHAFKFDNKRFLCHPFAQMMFDAIPPEIISECKMLISVPASRDRLKKRGYDQSKLLVKELSRLTDIPGAYDILKKRPGQKQMSLLAKEERRKNINGFYYCDKFLSGETVLLADDICTTGETLRACAHELKKAGAGKIYCVTVARTDLKTKG